MHVYCFCGFVRIYLLSCSPKVKISSRTHPNESVHWISSEFWRILTLSLSCQKPFWSFNLIINGGTSSLQCFFKNFPWNCLHTKDVLLANEDSVHFLDQKTLFCLFYFKMIMLCFQRHSDLKFLDTVCHLWFVLFFIRTSFLKLYFKEINLFKSVLSFMKFNEMQFNRGLVMHFIGQTNFTGGVYNSGWDGSIIDHQQSHSILKLNIKWFSPEVEQLHNAFLR